MKTLKKVLVFAMMLALLAALGVSAMAHELTVYAGNRGNFGGASYTQIDAADSSYAPAVTVTDSKYFAKGYTIAGHNAYDYYGNPTYSTSINFQDDEDIDYVVVYGVAATSISYTVNCVTSDGTVLQSNDYHANAGDNVTMVVPYIDGYEAVSANGVTLNTGVYYIQFSPVAGTTYTIVYQVPGTGTAAAADTDTTTTAAADNNAAADANAADNTVELDENATPQAQPGTEPNEDNTTVIDENDTPGGNFTQNQVHFGSEASSLTNGARIAIVCVGVLVIGACTFFIVMTLRKKKA